MEIQVYVLAQQRVRSDTGAILRLGDITDSEKVLVL